MASVTNIARQLSNLELTGRLSTGKLALWEADYCLPNKLALMGTRPGVVANRYGGWELRPNGLDHRSRRIHGGKGTVISSDSSVCQAEIAAVEASAGCMGHRYRLCPLVALLPCSPVAQG
jgi:hypothetical protein